MSFRCWHIDDYDPNRPRGGWLAPHSATAKEAAEEYAKRRHADNDYAPLVEIVVMSQDGSSKVFDVSAVPRWMLVFNASESSTPVPAVGRGDDG